MSHVLHIKKIPGPASQSHDKDRIRMWYWCVCGTWRGTATTLHEEPATEGFFRHLEEKAEESDRAHSALVVTHHGGTHEDANTINLDPVTFTNAVERALASEDVAIGYQARNPEVVERVAKRAWGHLGLPPLGED